MYGSTPTWVHLVDIDTTCIIPWLMQQGQEQHALRKKPLYFKASGRGYSDTLNIRTQDAERVESAKAGAWAAAGGLLGSLPYLAVSKGVYGRVCCNSVGCGAAGVGQGGRGRRGIGQVAGDTQTPSTSARRTPSASSRPRRARGRRQAACWAACLIWRPPKGFMVGFVAIL